MRRLILFVVALAVVASSLHAASYPPRYRWQTLTTEHFLVHFHQGEEELARRAGTIAERAHTELVPLLGWTPSGRTHLILTDHIDASNGSATPFPNNRIEVYVTAPGAEAGSELEHYDDWLNLVITHEYAHILHLDQARGPSAGLRRVFGRAPLLFPNQFSPLWFIEGLATLVESNETSGGRLKGTFVDMVLRTAAVEDRFFGAAKAGGITPEWPAGGSRYFYGAKFLDWLSRKHGPEKLKEYINEYSGNWVPYRVNATAENIYGRELTDLWDEWTSEQRRLYLDEHARIASPGLTSRTPITNLGYFTKFPTLSPDGSRLAYGHAGPYESPTIRVRDLTSNRDVDTRRVNTISPLSWSPDGQSIAYAQLEFRGSFAIESDLYLWTVGGRTRRLTSGARLRDPAFTPDGKTLIAVENRGGRNRLVEVDVTSGAIRALIMPNDFTQFSEPAVSPDGSRIAVAEWRSGRIDVGLYERSGARVRNLTESLQRATHGSPRFTRDGAILFSSDLTGVANLYSVDANGGVPRRLTNVYGGAFQPTSADGRRIYYSDYSARGFDIVSFNAASTYETTPRELPRDEVKMLTDITPMSGTPSPYRPWGSLIPRWWTPILGGAETEDEDESALTIGASTSGSDVLGFHSYLASVAATAYEEREDELAYILAYSYNRLYPTFTFAAIRYDDNADATILTRDVRYRYRETTERALALMTVPYLRAMWQAYGTIGVTHERLSTNLPFDVGNDTASNLGLFRGTLQGVRAGVLFDAAHTFGYSVSTEKGVSVRLDHEKLSGDADLQQTRAELRGYLPIPYSRSPLGRHVLAVRGAMARTTGDFVLQRELKVGGAGSGEPLSLELTDFPVRGYSTSTLRGRNAALASIEYRFPIYEIDRGPSVLPIFFRRIVGDVFYDRGTVWNDRNIALPAVQRPKSGAFEDANTISSAGVEIGADIVLGYFLPLRYRIGAAYLFDTRDSGNVEFFAALESSF